MFGFEIIIILVVLLLFFGLPVVIRAVDYPVALRFQQSRREDLSTDKAAYFQKQESVLTQSGFHRGPAFSIQDMGVINHSEIYADSQGNIATLALLTDQTETVHKSYLEFMTAYEPGPFLVTKSSAGLEMFYDPPGIITVSYYRITDIPSLLKYHERHRRDIEQKGHKARLIPTDQLLHIQEEIQSRLLKYQEERGILRYNEANGRLKGTMRLGLSLISHQLSLTPFGLPLSAKLVSFICGLACIILINLWSAMHIAPASTNGFFDLVVYALVFLGCGLIHGLFFRRKIVAWAVFIGLIPALFLVLTDANGAGLSKNSADYFMIYVASAFLGSRLRTFREMEGGVENLLYPGLIVCVIMIMFCIGNR
ncbi:hypothetical protein JXQ70_19320 [bacterium]|nr:hypothetical protein [bacterium]